MGTKQKRLDSFFTRNVVRRGEEQTRTNMENQASSKDKNPSSSSVPVPQQPPEDSNPLPSSAANNIPPSSRVENPSFSSIEHDPGLRLPIWKYAANMRDEIRRAYLRSGPHQLVLPRYPASGPESHPRRFQSKWYSEFPWLEYSQTKDRAYCFYCYLYLEESKTRNVHDAFTINGFKNWNKVKGKYCSFLKHVGDGPNSQHNIAVRFCDTLMNQSGHIDKVMQKQSADQIEKNRRRVKLSIDLVRLLSFQGIAFRGHDERVDSKNCGNYIEFMKHTASYNEEVASVVLGNAPGNAKYTSPDIQKEILHVFAEKVRKKIVEDICDSKYCIIVDEASDESKKEQMAIVLRYVDKKGYIQERFFDLVHVKDTSSSTLYSSICATLTSYKLVIENIRGQGYDGASNMRGEWKGLQALFLKDYPCAYYIHCMAHRLQLALVAAAREVHSVHEFFSNLSFIVNAVGASCKRQDELKAARAAEIAELLESGEIKSGKGANQIGTLKRAVDTRWSSHYASISSLLRMFKPTCKVLENIKSAGSNYKTKGDASTALKRMLSFEFVFILHMMKQILGISDVLCQALQQKSQDILSAITMVSHTKKLIESLRDNEWGSFLDDVISFCKKHDIDIPDFNSPYFEGRSNRKGGHVTTEHHYHFDIFNETINFQLQEIDSRFNERVVEILELSAGFNPKEGFKHFNADSICKLARKYYFLDFTEQELDVLKFQLKHFEAYVKGHPDLGKLSSITEVCQGLAETGKASHYYLVDRLIRLVLTLPVSTATTERAFSAMKIVKNRLRNKMDDDFLADNLVLYIEKDLAKGFSLDSILDDFNDVKERRVQLK